VDSKVVGEPAFDHDFAVAHPSPLCHQWLIDSGRSRVTAFRSDALRLAARLDRGVGEGIRPRVAHDTGGVDEFVDRGGGDRLVVPQHKVRDDVGSGRRLPGLLVGVVGRAVQG
jgi:hypothetical protein